MVILKRRGPSIMHARTCAVVCTICRDTSAHILTNAALLTMALALTCAVTHIGRRSTYSLSQSLPWQQSSGISCSCFFFFYPHQIFLYFDVMICIINRQQYIHRLNPEQACDGRYTWGLLGTHYSRLTLSDHWYTLYWLFIFVWLCLLSANIIALFIHCSYLLFYISTV